MPIDLADYSHGIKAALKKGGYACVYVASVQGGRPCRVGYAIDLCDTVKRLQRSSPLAITVEDAMWVPDRGIATMIAQSVRASIAPHLQAGGWHDLPAESVASAVHLDTFRLYPGATTVPHNQLIAGWAGRGSGSV
jgi:hypothetical protein